MTLKLLFSTPCAISIHIIMSYNLGYFAPAALFPQTNKRIDEPRALDFKNVESPGMRVTSCS